MKKNISLLALASLFVLSFSCSETDLEDPGNLREGEQTFPVEDFDRVSLSGNLNLLIQRGETYTITASGDTRNLQDLVVDNYDGLLNIQFNNVAERQHVTDIIITMPSLRALMLSQTEATIEGFESMDMELLDVALFKHSTASIPVSLDSLYAHVVDHSVLTLIGDGLRLQAHVASNSQLKGFLFLVDKASVEATRLSLIQVDVTQNLYAEVTETSEVTYMGEPAVTKVVDASSTCGPN
jgi:hypothetical protein